ncbi:hypothetical protein HMPREF0290_3011 [Corynebacterium efficiens YS-314]|uniref:Uncharacterized protein n=1 Tax=Corynebacterium efficiens (strain DSM 44549 / YS-314 / AJ 12310 / JCM 11189 / NBRC 100395) TaxID=196164 RepID=Q8FLI3_COREF|nr:hypothetical protein [Corynebacterium efficiens]EEW48385.1 hypothetical protein HMPREF0290_3011 [Corynebacterium efficiens YS-314]BAC19772.1 conserved hypothetical protein [Corynebacterium efficiens YS-314]
MNHQHNVNNAPAVNVQGDNNVINQQNQSQLVDDIVSTLREHGETNHADQLEKEKQDNGPKTALTKGMSWVANKAFAPPVLAALAPYIAQAAGMV